MFRKVLCALSACVVLAMLLVPLTAFAHEKVDSGNYHYEIGWANEPVIVGEKNGLDLFVASKDKPDEGLAGVESTLKFTVEYGSASQSYELVPVEAEPGYYTAAFVPTREGQYTFHLTGAINNEAVDVKVEPEEVIAAGKLAFPEAQPSAADLTAQLTRGQRRRPRRRLRSQPSHRLIALTLGRGVYRRVEGPLGGGRPRHHRLVPVRGRERGCRRADQRGAGE